MDQVDKVVFTALLQVFLVVCLLLIVAKVYLFFVDRKLSEAREERRRRICHDGSVWEAEKDV